MAPTIVIVPASFTPPEAYTRLSDTFKDHGIDSVIVSLPSVGMPESGKRAGTMTDDADEISRVVTDLFDSQGKQDVVLLPHSYGGIPASESMKSISKTNRGERPGIEKIIYVASIVLPVGISNDEMRKRPPPPWARIEGDWIVTDHFQGIQDDFNDLSAEEGHFWSSKMQQQSALSFAQRATYPGYNDVEVHYIRCTNDQCLPAEGTKRILTVIRESSGREPIVHEIAAGHFPQLSKPKELVALIQQILDI